MAAYETDVVVIAAGLSGLAAAVQAAEDGAKVLVVEKKSTVGGTANMGMGPLGIGTKYQKQQMYELTVEKVFHMFMEYTHYNADARLIHRYFEQSADTIEWLEDMGVEFEGAFRYFPHSEATWHIVKTDQGIGPGAASFMNKVLYAKALELGVEFLFKTPAKKILKKEGKVSGVLVTGQDGKELELSCKAAVICTGGAGCNPEMIKEETGYTFGVNMFNFAVPGITGDGLKMAWEAGSDKLPVRIEQAAQLVRVAEIPGSVANVFCQPNLLVNKFGKRFMNEEYVENTSYLSNALSHQKDKRGYMILDSSTAEYYMKNGVDIVSLVRPNEDVSDFRQELDLCQEHGLDCIAAADTLEELAEKMGVDKEGLLNTVVEYNDFCDCVDEEMYKNRKYLRPVAKAPFYCAVYAPGGYGTVGGIRINENCEVCGEDFMPISGLYAAGADACNIYEDTYMFLLPGNSMGYALNTGRIAGMSAAGCVLQKWKDKGVTRCHMRR